MTDMDDDGLAAILAILLLGIIGYLGMYLQ